MKEAICCKCSKDMMDPVTGNILMGAAVNVRSDMEGFSKEFLEDQLGNYKLDTDYFLCYECWFVGMGIVP